MLQLEHRKIAAGIIEKTYSNHNKKYEEFLNFYDQENSQQYQGLFHIEEVKNGESEELE